MFFYIGMLIVALLGGFIQTIVGFGAAVCILLYLTNFLSISEAPSVAAMVCLVLNFSLVVQFRKAINIKKIWCPMLIYSAISLLMVFTIRSIKITALTVFFGVFLIFISIYYLFLAAKIKIHDSGTGMMLASSGLSGLFAGLFSIGGPTLSIYYLAILGSGDQYIANIQLSFLATNVVLCIGRAVNGLLTVDMIPAVLLGISGALCGQILGRKLRSKLDGRLISKLVYGAVGVSGIIVILQQIFE